MEKQKCQFCEGMLKKKLNKTNHQNAVGEFDRMKQELEQMKNQIELKEEEIEELKKLNNDLHEHVLRKGSILIREENVDNAKLKFRKACIKHGIKLSYDHRGKRIRFSFKSHIDGSHHRVNFKLLFPPTPALENDAEELIEKIKTFQEQVHYEGVVKSIQCEIKREKEEYVIFY